jgi:hypothetical protein
MRSADFGHEGGVLSNVFITITNNANGALVLGVDGELGRGQVIDSLETRVGRWIRVEAGHATVGQILYGCRLAQSWFYSNCKNYKIPIVVVS